jgi:hypothetical protein
MNKKSTVPGLAQLVWLDNNVERGKLQLRLDAVAEWMICGHTRSKRDPCFARVQDLEIFRMRQTHGQPSRIVRHPLHASGLSLGYSSCWHATAIGFISSHLLRFFFAHCCLQRSELFPVLVLVPLPPLSLRSPDGPMRVAF